MIIISIINKRSLHQLEMRWFLIFLEPIEILYILPKIRFFSSFLLCFMLGLFGIFKGIRAKDDLIAVLNDSLTCYIYIEPTFVSIMDTKLMTVQLKLTILTMINKNSWFCHCSSNFTIFKVFEKQNLCFLKNYYLRILTFYDFKRSTWRTLCCNCNFLSTFTLYTWYLC